MKLLLGSKLDTVMWFAKTKHQAEGEGKEDGSGPKALAALTVDRGLISSTHTAHSCLCGSGGFIALFWSPQILHARVHRQNVDQRPTHIKASTVSWDWKDTTLGHGARDHCDSPTERLTRMSTVSVYTQKNSVSASLGVKGIYGNEQGFCCLSVGWCPPTGTGPHTDAQPMKGQAMHEVFCRDELSHLFYVTGKKWTLTALQFQPLRTKRKPAPLSPALIRYFSAI
jgi:hypothetical protein